MAIARAGEPAQRHSGSDQAGDSLHHAPLATTGGEPSAVGVVRADAAGRCFYVNEPACRILGSAREDVLGDGWLRLLATLGRASAAHARPEAAGGAAARGVCRFRRPDGREILLQVDSMPDVDAEGRTGGALYTLLDVTAQRRGEREARESNDTVLRQLEEIELLYQNTPAALCMVDRELRFVRVNRWMALIDRRSEQEHIGRTMEEILPDASRAQAMAIARRVLASGKAEINVEVHTISSREPSLEHWWFVSCHPLQRDGEVSGLLTVIQNGTAIKRAELEAQRRLDELEALYRNSPVGLGLLDRELRYVRVNEVLARVNGRPVSAHLGRKIEEIVPSVAPILVPLLRRVVEEGEPVRDLEISVAPPSDPEVEHVYVVTYDPVRTTEGAVVAVVATVSDVTALKRAEREAQLHLAELEAIYRQAPIGLAFIDPELRYVRTNEVLAGMHGRTPAEMAGMRVRDVIRVPAIRDPIVRSCERVLATGEPVIDEEVRGRPVRDPEREHTWLASRHPLRGVDGRLLGIIVVLHDVTDLEQAEQRARARLDELELIYRSSPVGLAYLDAEMRYVRVNDLLARINGRPISEHLGRRMDEIAPEFADQLVPVFRKVVATGQPVLSEELHGAARWDATVERIWLTSWHPLKSDARGVHGVIVVVKDITARKLRQAQLEEEKSRLAKAEQVASVGSWEWNLHDDRVWWSDELYALFGEDRRSFVPDSSSFYDHVHPNDRSRLREQLEAALRRDEPYRVEVRVVRDDGSERHVRACAKLERGPDGAPARLFGTCQDVTVAVAEDLRWRPRRRR